MELTDNAQFVLKKRYLKDNETPGDMIKRVASNLAEVEIKYYNKNKTEASQVEENFLKLLWNLEFIPNSPTLMNAGGELQQLSACFVLPVEDSIESIFDSLKHMALIQKTGGGTGFSFSRLRPSGDSVKSTNGVASGPVSFLRIFNASTEEIKQGGTRRGANMGILSCNHLDIKDFITCKEDGGMANFNLSVSATDEFMRAAQQGGQYRIFNPRDGSSELLDAGEVFELITEKAWKNGDPGMVFIDTINLANPTPHVGKFEATNPCGEQPLLPYEACCLGSINLGHFVSGHNVDWERLKETVHIAVHFLDNAIDATEYIIPQIKKMHKEGNRKIGLGVMGWHDFLVKMRVPYDSENALNLAREVMGFIDYEAKAKSVKLAEQRGVFGNFSGSIYDTGKKEDRVRNATRTTIAPTGSISIIAGASSGIEPYFAVAFERKNILEGTPMPEINSLFLKLARERGFYSDKMAQRVARSGSVQGDPDVPVDIQRLFKTAQEIDYTWHIKHQAAFQEHTDNAVSKTINLHHNAKLEDIKNAYFMAWEWGCKGITVYRDGSRSEQVLNKGIGGRQEKLKPADRPYELSGKTVRKNTPLGNLFVTVNYVDNKPFELFAQIGKAGSDIVAFTEAIARLVSLTLRCGISIEEIIKQLGGIGGGRSVGFGLNRILSVPDAIGKVLEEAASTNAYLNKRDLCPECGAGELVHAEGCAKCELCGYSEC